MEPEDPQSVSASHHGSTMTLSNCSRIVPTVPFDVAASHIPKVK